MTRGGRYECEHCGCFDPDHGCIGVLKSHLAIERGHNVVLTRDLEEMEKENARLSGREPRKEVDESFVTVTTLDEVFTEKELRKALKKGIKQATLVGRINGGWTKEEALSAPLSVGGTHVTLTRAEAKSIQKLGIRHGRVRSRLQRGWARKAATETPLTPSEREANARKRGRVKEKESWA